MRKLFALSLAVLCLATTAGASAPTPEASASGELRAMALSVKPGDIGLTRTSFGQEAWGIVMETEMDGGYYTLVVLGDGTTSLYFSKGGGIIGAGEHETVRRAGARFIDTANHHLDAATATTRFPAPAEGMTRFHFLTFDGARSYTAPTSRLGEGRDALSALFRSAHGVITEVRLASQ
jgi:hypothetical protein